jgi:oligopeptide/dipeptide ABC transporter ATP-binding protein
MTAPSPLLEVSGLRVAFATEEGRVQAVDDVSLSVGEREILAVVGESGSGKSVTALTVMGLTRGRNSRIEGSVRFAGEELLEASDERMRRIRGSGISMVFQDPMSALNPVMRVGAQIEEAVAAHEKLSGRARRTRAIELMERVGIPVPERRMRDYPHQFSGGMRQRVLIAMAIAGRPKLLLADEPTTALDVLIQDQILSLLLELQRDFGMSLILVSHDLGVIGEMCDRVAVMYAGEIVELSDTATLLGGPRHPYTISLLRSLPDVTSQSRYLRSIGGAPPALVDLPGGCRFAPRCPLALDRCREWDTELLEAGAGGHTARCWRHEETRREDAWPEQSYESA